MIIDELNLSLEHFRQIVILSGTDYNTSTITIKKAFDIYSQYESVNDGNTFYEWLRSRELVSDEFMNIYNLFEPDNSSLDVFLEAAEPSPKKISVSAIKEIMKPYRFIFI
jgi:hypothetical protein